MASLLSGRTAWGRSLEVYFTRRMLAVLLMGFSSGLPLLLGFSTLSYWLSKVGVDKGAIGLFAAIGIPYAFKYLWSPLIDQLPLPFFQRWLGRRRGWLLFLQVLLALSILWVGSSDPLADPWGMALAALVMATLSASQDIVVDAYRIEVLREEEQGAGAAVTQIGYRFGMIAAGAGALWLSDSLDWFLVYALMALLVGIGLLGTLIGPEPLVGAAGAVGAASREGPLGLRLALWFKRAVLDPFLDFLKRPGWVAILLFILLYKYGDAIAGTMLNPFYNELGFSGKEIGTISKLWGVIATLAGVALGGVMVARFGVLTALFLGGVLQAVTNLLFVWLFHQGHDVTALAVAVFADNFTGGLGSAAFVAYLSGLCNIAFTATQYALLSSLTAVGRTGLSTVSGYLVEAVGWEAFFIVTTLMAIPGLLLILLLLRLRVGAKRAEAATAET